MTVSYVLGGAALDAAFPFHFVVAADDAGGRDSDGALVIRQVGSRLAALGAQLAVGARLDACFRLDPALVSQTLAAVGALAGRAVLLECLDRPAQLRGQFVSLGDGTALAFLGSPWVSEAAELRMLGLAIEDFPVHDTVVDRLALIKQHRSALSDTRLLEAKAAECSRQLQERHAALEGDFARIERLASLGRVVAGVAHEVNTPLGVAVTAASVVDEQLVGLERGFSAGTLRRGELRAFLDEAGGAARLTATSLRRAVELVTHLKQTTVDQALPQPRRLNIARHVTEVLAGLAPVLRQVALRSTVAADGDLEVTTCPGALTQIVTNLVNNAAAHAYEPGVGGDVAFSARRVDEAHVELACEDYGKGMTPEVLQRMYEPFFTTRRGTGGTGLGMHLVHNLVTSVLGGQIAATSTEGRGTRIVITLPVQAPAQGTS